MTQKSQTHHPALRLVQCFFTFLLRQPYYFSKSILSVSILPPDINL